MNYPRTGSRYISEDVFEEVPVLLRKTGATITPPLNRHSVDNAMITDHHAIIPTGETPSGMSADETTIYQMVVSRFIEAFFPDSEEERMLVQFTDGTNSFTWKACRQISLGWKAVQNRMQKSKQAVKPLVPNIRGKVLQTMRTSPETEEKLRQRLEEQGLRVAIKKNESGRIYGITFIDDEGGFALNGSRLGKGYAANVFNTYFSNPTHNPFLDEALYGSPSEHLEQTITNQSLHPNSEEGDNLVDELIEDVIEGSFTSTGNDDWNEAALQRKLRRQSKVNLRRRKH